MSERRGITIKRYRLEYYFPLSTDLNRPIDIMLRVFANGPRDQGSIPGRVIPKTQKMVLDPSLLDTQYYKVQVKDKAEQSRKKSSALAYTSV